MTGKTNYLNKVTSADQLVKLILDSIGKEREQEIIARRYGLYERKETLEQIGELLGITRERVRQLEKIVVAKLKDNLRSNEIKEYREFTDILVKLLKEKGNVCRALDISEELYKTDDKITQSRIMFFATLSQEFTTLDNDELFYASVALSEKYSATGLKSAITKIVNEVKKIGKANTSSELAKKLKINNPKEFEALALSSKKMSNLNNLWGLAKWPIVNPKNIRDKIYIILAESKKHMHFNDIAKLVKESEFKRNNVTTQAIHNELIKDDRFVLIGRGIYALKEWGYEAGTVTDVIKRILQDAEKPLHRDEIVKRVLENRYVKETTILLNLQGKKDFKRVAKGTYTLNDQASL